VEAMLSVVAIYSFILIGFFAKKKFGDEIDEKSLTLLSVYFLQPILAFWGLNGLEINSDLIIAPILYFCIVVFVMFITLILSKKMFSDEKDRSIFTVTTLITNTGNLGIPLGIAIFGENSVAYTMMVNIANLLFIYTFGVYYYSKGNYTVKESIKNVIKLPIIWFALLALSFNYFGIKVPPQIGQALQMGAYATIVIQLMIFGIYMSKVKVKEIDIKLNMSVNSIKFLLLPLVGFFVLYSIDYLGYVGAIVFMQLFTPLAVNNVNLASIYECKPIKVTSLILTTSILFIPLVTILLYVLELFFKVSI
jgi:predicted permease